jgi:Holliday junction DNA helicase RuvA
MIRQIRGRVLEVEATSVTIEVAGFGIEVHTPLPSAYVAGTEAILATHLAVKQDGMELYGFAEVAERDFFEKLLNVSGVGPKTALSVLRRSPREAVESAIAARDLSYLTKVVGLGKKLAEKMLVELSEKVASTNPARDGADTEVFETLVALGYTEREARRAVQAIPETAVGKDARLRAALSHKP